MKKFKFYGHSDDIIIVNINGKDDDETYYPNIRLSSEANQELLYVHATYPNTGCWSFGVGLAGEGIPLPNWKIYFEREHEYSVALIIEAPDDTIWKSEE